MKTSVWHGTNQEFERFETRFLGLSTFNSASQTAIFFAERPETAWDYATSASRKIVANHESHQAAVADLLARMDEAINLGRHELYEDLCLQLEDLEGEAIQADPSGQRILRCDLLVDRVFEISGNERQVVTNLAAVLEKARDDGYDAVCLKDIQDTPTGIPIVDTHWAVFDPEKIAIREVCFSLEEVAELDRVEDDGPGF